MTAQTNVSGYRHEQAQREAMKGSVGDWVRRVRAEYLEMPGLHLNRKQVQRLWSLDDRTCDVLLAELTAVRFLRVTAGGAYVRMDGGGA